MEGDIACAGGGGAIAVRAWIRIRTYQIAGQEKTFLTMSADVRIQVYDNMSLVVSSGCST